MASTALRPRVVALATLTVMAAPTSMLSTQSGAAAAPDKTVTASNTTPITIPDAGFADPLPGSISVPADRAVVTDVDVTLTGITHTCVADLNVMLVSPNGRRATLLSSAGNCDENDPAVTLTLDDEATDRVPRDTTPLPSGAYQPTDEEADSDPTVPTTAPASLEVFDGGPASGSWHLYVVDNLAGDGGAISGGWSLDIDYTDTVAPVGTVAIDAAATVTDSQTTTLTLDASDPTPGTGVAQMRFSNDGTTWSAFQAYAPTTSWILAAGDGTKTVWAQVTDGFGNPSTPVSDAITLDTTSPKAKKLSPKAKARGVSAQTNVSFVASEALAAGTVTKATVTLTTGGATIKAKVTYSAGKKTVTLKPATSLTGDTAYKVKIATKVTDLAGNRIAGKSWSFRTR